MNMFDRVRAIVADELSVEESCIMPESRLENDLGADSLAKLNIAMALEEEFGIDLGEDPIEMATVKEIVDYVEAIKAGL